MCSGLPLRGTHAGRGLSPCSRPWLPGSGDRGGRVAYPPSGPTGSAVAAPPCALAGSTGPAREAVSHLLLDLIGRVLGGLQVLHQGRVPQEVPRRRRQPGQQGVLQLLQDNLEFVLGLGEVRLREGQRAGSAAQPRQQRDGRSAARLARGSGPPAATWPGRGDSLSPCVLAATCGGPRPRPQRRLFCLRSGCWVQS